jgi:hypothetical protein
MIKASWYFVIVLAWLPSDVLSEEIFCSEELIESFQMVDRKTTCARCLAVNELPGESYCMPEVAVSEAGDVVVLDTCTGMVALYDQENNPISGDGWEAISRNSRLLGMTDGLVVFGVGTSAELYDYRGRFIRELGIVPESKYAQLERAMNNTIVVLRRSGAMLWYSLDGMSLGEKGGSSPPCEVRYNRNMQTTDVACGGRSWRLFQEGYCNIYAVVGEMLFCLDESQIEVFNSIGKTIGRVDLSADYLEYGTNGIDYNGECRHAAIDINGNVVVLCLYRESASLVRLRRCVP